MPSRIEPEPIALKASTPPAKPLSAFKRLSQVVSLYTPSDPPNFASPTHPTTILFCSWMNASPKHIDYYTRTYMSLYPSARIILITINTKQFMLETEVRRRKDIAEAITALLAEDQSAQRLHVHSLSNGGAKRVYGVMGAYKTRTGKTLQVKTHIIDSSPGIPRFRRDLHALTMPFRNISLFLRLAFTSIVYVAVCVIYVVVNWLPKSVWHQLVWGPTFGFYNKEISDEKCLKAYVYSKEDMAIDWKDVEAHAKVTKEKGYRVVTKLVEGAEHVQQFRGKGGEQDYWMWIQRIWEIGMGIGEK
ncbi:uncharacterized protein RSE6_06248 [Rhynchosporium secalis]|uniref:Indole-diterpene biosynthesis protein PaxU n=1 Tax=Rhynchosporium secalis TaxID=38038 RepID=A0A1E1M9W3_RHYSE|nr:uncharacterized protein RSE6_06248 [Rhynchosporium secalis]